MLSDGKKMKRQSDQQVLQVEVPRPSFAIQRRNVVNTIGPSGRSQTPRPRRLMSNGVRVKFAQRTE